MVEDYNGCLYRKNLDKGIVFYGKNANNMRLKHVGDVLKDVVEELETVESKVDREPKETKENISARTSLSDNKINLDCFGRNFNVGRYSKSGYTYGLTNEEFEFITNVFLDKEIPFVTMIDINKCVLEGDAYEPANARIIININDCETSFIVGNYNSMYILKRYAEGIKKAFERKGITAKLEVVEYKQQYVVYRQKSDEVLASKDNKENVPDTKTKSTKEAKVAHQSYKQISMFDAVA
jgi:hypothetical protein